MKRHHAVATYGICITVHICWDGVWQSRMRAPKLDGTTSFCAIISHYMITGIKDYGPEFEKKHSITY